MRHAPSPSRSSLLPTCLCAALALLALLASQTPAAAFCGFYVGRATGDLFNQASKVVYARKGQQSVITMVSDYQGALKDFALVVPVPVILEEEDVRLASSASVTHLDDYSAPRLVEYHDDNPCQVQKFRMALPMASPMVGAMPAMEADAEMGVTIERSYSVGEYDILILSAEQADGLITWLNREGYQIPPKAGPVVKDYLAAGMKFFVAKVSLEAVKSEAQELNPLQMRFESGEFMLPIRLGMANAKPGQDQDLIAYFLTERGQVDLLSYPLTRIPADIEVPVKTDTVFQDFYRRTFAKAIADRPYATAFLEYAWDMNWCDPCAADPLSNAELQDLGAFWIEEPKPLISPEEEAIIQRFDPADQAAVRQALIIRRGGGAPMPAQSRNAFVTRIHMRYREETHPNELVMQVTDNRENFQGRYIMRHAAVLNDAEKQLVCGIEYIEQRKVYEAEAAANFERLTGSSLNDLRAQAASN